MAVRNIRAAVTCGADRRPHRPPTNGWRRSTSPTFARRSRSTASRRRWPPRPGSSRRRKVWRWRSAIRSRPRCRARCSACSGTSRSRSTASTSWSTSTAIAAPATTSRVSSTDGIYDAIVTNETQFNTDWDGNWQHAVGEDEEGWTVEVLIPWYIAPMRDGRRRQAHARDLPGPRRRHDRRTRRVAAGELRAAALPVRLRGHRSDQLQPVAAGDHAVRVRALRRRGQEQRRRCRRRRVLEAERPDAAHGHA